MPYPKYIKENNQTPITYRVILSVAYGIELVALEGYLHYREVRNQAEIDVWESDLKWGVCTECNKSEVLEIFIQCETYLGDKRAKIDKINGIELYQ